MHFIYKNALLSGVQWFLVTLPSGAPMTINQFRAYSPPINPHSPLRLASVPTPAPQKTPNLPLSPSICLFWTFRMMESCSAWSLVTRSFHWPSRFWGSWCRIMCQWFAPVYCWVKSSVRMYHTVSLAHQLRVVPGAPSVGLLWAAVQWTWARVSVCACLFSLLPAAGLWVIW